MSQKALSASDPAADAATEKPLPGSSGKGLFLSTGFYSVAFTTSSVTFLASPNSIMVLGRKNSSFSTPA